MILYYQQDGEIKAAVKDSDVIFFHAEPEWQSYTIDEISENADLCRDLLLFVGIAGRDGKGKYNITAGQLNIVDSWFPLIPTMPQIG
jgi:hypothetical protein